MNVLGSGEVSQQIQFTGDENKKCTLEELKGIFFSDHLREILAWE